MLFAIMRKTVSTTYPHSTYWLRARRNVGLRSERVSWELMRGFGEPLRSTRNGPCSSSFCKGLLLFSTYEGAARAADRFARAMSAKWELWDWFGDDVQVIGWVEYCGDATGHPHEDCAACPALSRACAVQRRQAIQGGNFSPSIRRVAWSRAEDEATRRAVNGAGWR